MLYIISKKYLKVNKICCSKKLLFLYSIINLVCYNFTVFLQIYKFYFRNITKSFPFYYICVFYVIFICLHLTLCVNSVETVDNFVNNFYLYVLGFILINSFILLLLYENYLFIIFIVYVYSMYVRATTNFYLQTTNLQMDWLLGNKL